MTSIKAHSVQIAKQMFVVTADRNYILARSAFFDELDLDFFWLSLHALEKYYKAILLINGETAKGYSHDLVKLHAAVMKLEPRLPIGPLGDPGVDGLHWRDEPVGKYLVRLNEYGNAANRYATYGFVLFPEDLFKVDQLIWAVRRCCRPFSIEHWSLDGPKRRVDYVDVLRRNRREWRIGGFMPLEELVLNAPDNDPRRVGFLRLNVPFAPDAKHILDGWRSSSNDPPLADWFMRLTAPNATLEERTTAADVLKWTVEHIKFSPKDEKEIRDAVAKHTP